MNGRLATARRLSAPFILLVAFILLPAEARAASVVNARTYGMVNGNKTDNSAALLRACQAGVRKGLPVLIPKGRYYLASPVHLPAGVKLRGAGGHTSAATDARWPGGTYEASSADIRSSEASRPGSDGLRTNVGSDAPSTSSRQRVLSAARV